MTDVSPLLTLGAVTVTTAATQTTTPLTGLQGLAGLSGFIRFAGTGGTSVDAYVQTSPDGGTTWADLYEANFTASGVALFSLVNGASANLALTDGTLASNTALNAGAVPLFDQYRLKIKSVGTWVSGIVSAYVMPRG
jgi:hypothetical protein